MHSTSTYTLHINNNTNNYVLESFNGRRTELEIFERILYFCKEHKALESYSLIETTHFPTSKTIPFNRCENLEIIIGYSQLKKAVDKLEILGIISENQRKELPFNTLINRIKEEKKKVA